VAVAGAILVLRPARRPLDNVWLPLQMCAAGTLAFARTQDEELSAQLFYVVVGITLVYIVSSALFEAVETMSLHATELALYTQNEHEKAENKKRRDAVSDAVDAAVTVPAADVEDGEEVTTEKSEAKKKNATKKKKTGRKNRRRDTTQAEEAEANATNKEA
jgi:hypothetical protein